MWCAIPLLLALASPGPAGAAAPARDDQLKPGEYRVKVEVLLEPTGESAVYRVQVWTVGKQEVLFGVDDWTIALEGEPRAEPDGKLYRTDWVIIARLRDASGPNAKQRVLERTYECNGGASFSFGADVAADAKLADLAQFKAATTTAKLDAEVPVGKLFDQKLEVAARPPRKK